MAVALVVITTINFYLNNTARFNGLMQGNRDET